LVFVGCGGGGSGEDSFDNVPFPDINSVFNDFNKPYDNIIYITGYDGLTESQATVFLDNLDVKSFTCNSNSIIECERYNPTINVLYALGQIGYNNNYIIGETIIGDGGLITDKLTDIFPTIYNRRTDYSIDKCYTDDITSEIQAYKDDILLQGYVYNSNNGFYIKYDDDFVYAWGYTQNSVSWNLVRKNYYNLPDSELFFGCQKIGYN
jgi:hypothetical protein